MDKIFTLGLVVLSTLTACDKGQGSLGDLPQTTGASESAATSDAQLGGVGAPCQLSVVPVSHRLETDNAGCASQMCLYAENRIAAPGQACTESSDCSGFAWGVICDPATSQCVLDPDRIAEASMCTALCEKDSDCVGVDETACEGSFVCGPVTSIGPVCCQRVCVCSDHYDGAVDLTENCEAGTQPGCCTQDPPGEGCGG